jgi:hypothetical protein
MVAGEIIADPIDYGAFEKSPLMEFIAGGRY